MKKSIIPSSPLRCDRIGTWTTSGQTTKATYGPTAEDDEKVLYSLPDGSVTFDATHDAIKTGDLAWTHPNITYVMPQAITLHSGIRLQGTCAC